MNIKDKFSKSELILLKVICDTHTLDDEQEMDENKGYQRTKKSMFKKLKKIVIVELEDEQH